MYPFASLLLWLRGWIERNIVADQPRGITVCEECGFVGGHWNKCSLKWLHYSYATIDELVGSRTVEEE